ncbi:Xaa-Pro dipeptidase [Pluralibacter gergoviae]|nr:Xaa-Pro dipeptidase [Pluralibacter gergoviae]
MESLAALYKNHIATLQERAKNALDRYKLDALLIHSGELMNVFLDDHAYPFKVNPQFKAWVPVTQVPNCWLLVDGVNKPKLWFYLPVDYWHNVEPLPSSFWTEEVEVIALPKADGIGSQLPAARGNIAYIGPVPERALGLEIAASNINPKGVIDYLHFYRSYKTDYELACMREAQKMAVNGHQAAGEAFMSGMSEFDINLAYLTATGHRDIDVPYGNIVALNEHAAVLHYTKLDHRAPAEMRSFLLDAGAEYNGYAADLTPHLGGESRQRLRSAGQGRQYRAAGADRYAKGGRQLRRLPHPVPSAHCETAAQASDPHRHERRGDGRERPYRTLYAARSRPSAGPAGARCGGLYAG